LFASKPMAIVLFFRFDSGHRHYLAVKTRYRR
jgi:hypothetical protein